MKKTASMILMMVLLHALHSTTFAQSLQTLKGTSRHSDAAGRFEVTLNPKLKRALESLLL